MTISKKIIAKDPHSFEIREFGSTRPRPGPAKVKTQPEIDPEHETMKFNLIHSKKVDVNPI